MSCYPTEGCHVLGSNGKSPQKQSPRVPVCVCVCVSCPLMCAIVFYIPHRFPALLPLPRPAGWSPLRRWCWLWRCWRAPPARPHTAKSAHPPPTNQPPGVTRQLPSCKTHNRKGASALHLYPPPPSSETKRIWCSLPQKRTRSLWADRPGTQIPDLAWDLPKKTKSPSQGCSFRLCRHAAHQPSQRRSFIGRVPDKPACCAAASPTTPVMICVEDNPDAWEALLMTTPTAH